MRHSVSKSIQITFTFFCKGSQYIGSLRHQSLTHGFNDSLIQVVCAFVFCVIFYFIMIFFLPTTSFIIIPNLNGVWSVHSTLFLLKVLMPCWKCSWFKVVIMIFWKGWRSPTSLKPKIQCFLVEGTGSYRLYFLLNLQLKWNAFWMIRMWKIKVLMAWALLTKAMLIQTLRNKWNKICMKQLAGGKHMENNCFPRTLKFKMKWKYFIIKFYKPYSLGKINFWRCWQPLLLTSNIVSTCNFLTYIFCINIEVEFNSNTIDLSFGNIFEVLSLWSAKIWNTIHYKGQGW